MRCALSPPIFTPLGPLGDDNDVRAVSLARLLMSLVTRPLGLGWPRRRGLVLLASLSGVRADDGELDGEVGGEYAGVWILRTVGGVLASFRFLTRAPSSSSSGTSQALASATGRGSCAGLTRSFNLGKGPPCPNFFIGFAPSAVVFMTGGLRSRFKGAGLSFSRPLDGVFFRVPFPYVVTRLFGGAPDSLLADMAMAYSRARACSVVADQVVRRRRREIGRGKKRDEGGDAAGCQKSTAAAPVTAR